jgi:hypothetical protein
MKVKVVVKQRRDRIDDYESRLKTRYVYIYSYRIWPFYFGKKLIGIYYPMPDCEIKKQGLNNTRQPFSYKALGTLATTVGYTWLESFCVMCILHDWGFKLEGEIKWS